MTTKHRPGPWRIYNGETMGLEIGDAMICDKDKEEVAIVRFNAADCVDNARLIAAAPELLEALIETVDAYVDAKHGGTSEDSRDDPIVGRACAALAKARGE